jgi:hypothetical protein
MTRRRRRVVLVLRQDGEWIAACESLLRRMGIDSVEVHNCWASEIARELHDGDAVVIDGHLLCEFVSADRPGPVLSIGPKVPVLIFNAEALDEQRRAAAMAHNALMLEGDDFSEIAHRVEAVLPLG